MMRSMFSLASAGIVVASGVEDSDGALPVFGSEADMHKYPACEHLAPYICVKREGASDEDCQASLGSMSQECGTGSSALPSMTKLRGGKHMRFMARDASTVRGNMQSLMTCCKELHVDTTVVAYPVESQGECPDCAVGDDAEPEETALLQFRKRSRACPAESPPWGLNRLDDGNQRDNTNYYPAGLGTNTVVFIVDTGIRSTHDEFKLANGSSRVLGRYVASGLAQGNDDDNGHGTHCAGTAAGKTYGVAKGASLYNVQVLGGDGSGSLSGVVDGMQYVAEKCPDGFFSEIPGAACVVSMSLGAAANEMINEQVADMASKKITVVVAAGNSNEDAACASPASATEAITVGSTDDTDARSSFSNFGSVVDIFAPGRDIKSAWNTGDTATKTISGTSMACPHVAGAVAMIHGMSSTPLAPPEVRETLLKLALLEQVPTSSPDYCKHALLQVPKSTGTDCLADETVTLPTGNASESPVCSSSSTPTCGRRRLYRRTVKDYAAPSSN
jgi:hypothetical protein